MSIKYLTKLFLIQLFVVLILSFFFLEIYLRLNKDKFHSYGWFFENNINNKIQECNENSYKDEVYGVFGDSFVEYYLYQKFNITNLLEQNGPIKYCNFGLSGSNIPSYINRIKKVLESGLELKKILIIFYEGNDFSDFLVNDQSASVLNRNISLIKKLYSYSYAFQFINNEILSVIIKNKKINFEDLIYKNFINYDKDLFLDRLSGISKSDIELFKKGKLNLSWLSIGLTKPNYFNEIHSNKNLSKQKKIVNKYIQNLNFLKNKYNADINIFIIPHAYYLDEKTKEQWSNTFGFYNTNIHGKTSISDYLEKEYNNIKYINIFTYNDFIPLDGHLNYKGNIKLKDFILEEIKK